ncbi:HTH-type transcriptional regulator/antitoxin HigA [Runella defluvii]|uniref:HTH-type transcriptional regulator/antitoxin HigA n=1 Tax=Runella defluvii TaxID=370973 RepID=A0A7W5ZK60_9BACT|nr:transcriptional regulator [Runella defluvii]MBB3837349.1 HTH-type transcriptional regulator/antitoxin HigA [Runella defluvii]
MLSIKSLIKTEEEYDNALERAYQLTQLDLEEESAELAELELLSVLIEQYEKVHYPIAPPHPIEAIKFQLDQMGLSEADLGRILGSRSHKSEILSGKRKMSISMIRILNKELKIPAETLIAAY